MTKYHINTKTGNPGACSAAPGGCPFGGDSNHFESEQEARTAYEERNTSTPQPTLAKKPQVRLENRAAKHTLAKTWNEVPKEVSTDGLKNASAYAVIHNQFVPVTYEQTVNPKKDFDNLDDYDGSDWLDVASKNYLIATPNGGYIKVTYASGIDAQRDDYWEFNPEAKASYDYYTNLADLQGNKPKEAVPHMEIDTDEVFREKTSNYDRQSYDHSSSSSARQAALAAIERLPKPYEISRIAQLKNSEEKIPRETLLNDKYFKSTNDKVRAASVTRKEFPTDMQAEALADGSARVKVALAGRPDIQKEHFETILALSDPWKHGTPDRNFTPREALLRNPKLPLRLMNQMAKDGTHQDMRALHNNPGLTPKARETINSRAQKLGLRLW